MAECALRCESCGNYIDGEDIFCSNCGRESPPEGEKKKDVVEEGFVGFDCESCGASLTYDAVEEGLRCSFCGSVSMKRQPAPTGRIRAESYLAFQVSREQAVEAFRRWIGKGFFRPFGIREAARVVSMQSVFLPFWRFSARTHTYFTGDSSRTPAGARADWCPHFGEREGEIGDVLVCASGSLHAEEISGLQPFEFSGRRPYAREEIRSVPVEDFGVSRRGARPRARSLLIEAERGNCAALIPGNTRNVHVNPLLSDLRSEPVLLPVWINAYRYRDEVFRFCVNGQTGKVVGKAPVSLAKIALVVGAAVLAVAVAILVGAAMAS